VALETIANLFNSESGIRYMIVNGHIQWLIQESCNHDTILSSFALRASSDFFLKMAEVVAKSDLALGGSESVLQMNLWGGVNSAALISQFLEAVMMQMDSTSDATRFAALSAITSFASSSLDALCHVAGVAAEGASGTVFTGMRSSVATGGATVLEAWMDMLRLKLEIQGAVVCSIASVMLATQRLCRTEEEFAQHAQAVLSILRKVGDVKDTLTMNYLIKLAKQPIPVGKFAAFEMFRSLACLQKGWGLDLMFGHTDLVDFIMVSMCLYLLRILKIADFLCCFFIVFFRIKAPKPATKARKGNLLS
jgi:hypothetical protein